MTYPSRISTQEKIIPRQDPVVYGSKDDSAILNEKELNFFADNGYLVLPGLLADEVETLLGVFSANLRKEKN